MANETKHTPGPWDRTNLTVHTKSSAQRGALGIARVYDAPETEACANAMQATANANLIAAAPALLEALRPLLALAAMVVRDASVDDDIAEVIKRDMVAARAAIAQAEGKA
jgi:hypothetical protein